MHRCPICTDPIDGPDVIHLDGAGGVHSACLAGRLPQDAVVALIAAVVLALAPPIVVWAG